jgi:dihydropteroate synthase
VSAGAVVRTHSLQVPGGALELGVRPLLMGVVNASPDSFSDGGCHRTVGERVALARELVAAGADGIDVGGESATTGRPPVGVEEEIARVVPLVERLVAEVAVSGDRGSVRRPMVSVDTYKPAVAAAALAAGAGIVNDVSGLRDPALARVCAEAGAALVVMHTAAAPRECRQDPALYGDVVGEVLAFLRARVEEAIAQGLTRAQLLVDPGPDFAKTPAQTVELLVHAERLHELGLPVVWAVSRKDFVGALTGRAPRARGAGTLAALAHGLDVGAHVYRVHDVAAAADFIAVRAALRGERPPERDLVLAEELRHERMR